MSIPVVFGHGIADVSHVDRQILIQRWQWMVLWGWPGWCVDAGSRWPRSKQSFAAWIQYISTYCTNLENLEISRGRNSIFLTVYFELLWLTTIIYINLLNVSIQSIHVKIAINMLCALRISQIFQGVRGPEMEDEIVRNVVKHWETRLKRSSGPSVILTTFGHILNKSRCYCVYCFCYYALVRFFQLQRLKHIIIPTS